MATWAAAPTGSDVKPAAFFGWRVVAAAFTVLFVAYPGFAALRLNL